MTSRKRCFGAGQTDVQTLGGRAAAGMHQAQRERGRNKGLVEHLFCGLEELAWTCPENAGRSFPAKLRILRLERCHRDGNLQMLRDLPGLTSLALSYCYEVTDARLMKEHVGQLSNLTSLDLHDCEQLAHEGLKELVGQLPNLTSPSVSDCYEITHEGLKELGHMAALMTDLKCNNYDETWEMGVEVLSFIPNLVSLDLKECSQIITDNGLKHPRHFSRLISLDLKECSQIMTVKGLKHPRHLSRLVTSLDLKECSQIIADKGLKHLGRMYNLASIDLSIS